jgi:hypothetical protein
MNWAGKKGGTQGRFTVYFFGGKAEPEMSDKHKVLVLVFVRCNLQLLLTFIKVKLKKIKFLKAVSGENGCTSSVGNSCKEAVPESPPVQRQ